MKDSEPCFRHFSCSASVRQPLENALRMGQSVNTSTLSMSAPYFVHFLSLTHSELAINSASDGFFNPTKFIADTNPVK